MFDKFLSRILVMMGLAAILFLNSPAFGEGFDLTVNALNNCLDLRKGVLNGDATHAIPNGRYVVSLASQGARYCVDPTYFNGCPVPKAVFYVTTDNRPSEWFHVVERGKPIVIDVTGTGTDANNVHAFFIDIVCDDNSGANVLKFRRVTTEPTR